MIIKKELGERLVRVKILKQCFLVIERYRSLIGKQGGYDLKLKGIPCQRRDRILHVTWIDPFLFSTELYFEWFPFFEKLFYDLIVDIDLLIKNFAFDNCVEFDIFRRAIAIVHSPPLCVILYN